MKILESDFVERSDLGMQPPNSDFEIRPCLSEYHFYTNNGKKIIDFNELQFGDQLGIEFTLSGLDRIYKNDNDNRISIVVVFYERVGQLGFRLHNIWALYLANEDMEKPFKKFNLDITDIPIAKDGNHYDMYLRYPMLKILTFPDKFNSDKLDEDSAYNLIAIPQHNEILDVKIPMIPKEK